MKKRLSIILCIALVLCMIPTSFAFAAKKVKSKSVSVAPQTMTLAVGDAVQLSATMKPANSTDKLSWSSSNSSVATVTSKGMVQGVSVGSATITVKTSSKKTASCRVVVKKYATQAEIVKIASEGLKEKFATKDSVLELIKQNTYTKSEIDSKISSITSGGSCDCSNALSPSGKLAIHEGQKMSFSDHGKSFTITDVDITKSLYNDFVESPDDTKQFYAYKYDVKITGTTDSDILFSEVFFTNKFGGSFCNDYYTSNYRPTVEITNGKFIINSTTYENINASEVIISHLQTKDDFADE